MIQIIIYYSKGRRKTLVVGFITLAKFILAITKDLLYKENDPSQYILTWIHVIISRNIFSKIWGHWMT